MLKVCWGFCTDLAEIVPLLDRSRSIPRISAGGLASLDSVGVALLLGNVVHMVSVAVSHPLELFEADAGDEWNNNTFWLGVGVL